MRKAEKEKNKILVPNSVRSRLGEEIFEKNSKKIQKVNKISFRHYFQPKRDEMGQEREKKISVPNSAHTRFGQENSEKKIKKIPKIKKPFSSIIFCQNGMIQAEKERKKFQSQIRLILDPGKKIPKKIAKNLKKKKKKLFPALFLAKMG